MTQRTPSSEVLAAAARGWKLIPVERRGKKPLFDGWPEKATSNLGQLAQWAREFPGCNWGVATGKVSGFFVVDVDVAHGNGFETLATMEARGLTLPATFTVKTGSGGEHRYFVMPEQGEIRNNIGKLGPGLDIRGSGGYVLLAGSTHANGQPYVVTNPAAIAVAPALLKEWLRQKPAPAAAPNNGAAQCAKVPEGQRHATLVSLAGTMHRRGMTPAAIEAALLAENEQRCDPPLPRAKVVKIARDIVHRYPASAPPATTPNGKATNGTTAAEPGVKSAADGAAVPHSDDALALLFAKRHGEDLRYTAEWGQWSMWDGQVWRKDSTLAIFDRVRKINREVSATCTESGRASRLSSAQTVAAVERLARSDRRIAATVAQWDDHPWLLNTPAGIVDLRTGTLRPTSREDYCRHITAAAPDGDCPLWLQFLDRITAGDRELEGFLQRVAGYVLTGSTSEHALFFLHGNGGNGKSVFVKTLAYVLADYAKPASVETFLDTQQANHPTDLAGLQGARLVTASETEANRHWAEAKIKALTGGDAIAARFMRQDFFSYTPVFKLVITGNHKPRLRSVNEAIRRLQFIGERFVVFLGGNDDLEGHQMQAEAAGILAWAIAGCIGWQRQGLNPPQAVTEATVDYLKAEDAIGRWMEERCETGRQHATAPRPLFTDWCQWCDMNRERSQSEKWFVQQLEARGFERSGRAKNVRLFLGLSLLSDLGKNPQE